MKKTNLPAVKLAAKPKALEMRAPKSAMARFDPKIRAAAKSGGGEIEILGEIGEAMWGGIDAAYVKRKLEEIGSGPVLITLNSPGGDAFEGIAIYNVLREYKGDVTIRVLGLAASAASVIAMAGDRIEIGEAAFLMIHSAWGVVMGNQNDLREFADILDKLDSAVAGLYSRRTGKDEDEILEMMKKETWMTGPDAVDLGFADVAIGAPKKGAKASAPQTVSSRVNVPVVLAALGDRHDRSVRLSLSPGASGPVVNLSHTQGNPEMKTTREQIADFEAKRQANMARLDAIMAKAGEESRTLDKTETEEYDTLAAENTSIDAHLGRLKAHEASLVARGTPALATVNTSAADTDAARGGNGGNGNERQNSGIISVASRAEKGIAFTRYVKAIAMARGNLPGALAIASANKNWKDTTPQVERVLMTAVGAGDTTSAGWASELVYNQNLVDEFVELLRPQTILGKMTGLTRVPFNIRMSGQDSGSTAYWVGQGKAIPVSKLHTLEVTLGIAKAAGLVVLTEELVRSSAPSAELLVRNDLTKTIATFCDVQFVDPNVAAVANVSPASITNGVTAIVPTGTTQAALRVDVQTLFRSYIDNNMDPTGAVWIMDPTMALAISLMINALGQPTFPGITMNGGMFFGLPVIVSNSANIPGSPDSGHMIILANAPDIMFADDGGLTIDASREASIEMTDAPTGNAVLGTAGTTSLVSMFQESSVAIKAVRFINWKKRRSTAVAYIKEAAYVS